MALKLLPHLTLSTRDGGSSELEIEDPLGHTKSCFFSRGCSLGFCPSGMGANCSALPPAVEAGVAARLTILIEAAEL